MPKSVLKVAAAVALAAGTIVVNPSSALAAYSGPSACADQYGGSWVEVSDGRRALRTPFGDTWGTVYLTYNNSTGENCVATVKTAFAGTSTDTWATLKVQGVGSFTDRGSYRYYAAKKYKAAGKCVAYEGGTGDTRVDRTYATGGRSAWGNCG